MHLNYLTCSASVTSAAFEAGPPLWSLWLSPFIPWSQRIIPMANTPRFVHITLKR